MTSIPLPAAVSTAPDAAVTSLGHWVEPIHPDVHCDAVYEKFSTEPDLFALPVVDGTTPVGLVHRETFMVKLADRFGRALYENKPITRLMDEKPLVVRHDMDVEELGALILQTRPSVLLEGFIVVREGAYTGIGTALSLLSLTLENANSRNIELDEARQRAEAASFSKSAFLANMSHELRTPLNAIIGFSEMLSEQILGPMGQPRYLTYAQDICDSGKHLLGIINDILDIAKVEAGRLELAEETIEVRELMISCVRLMAGRANSGGVTLALVDPKVRCTVTGDRRLLKQVLLNLMSNAVKFTNPGGRVEIYANFLVDGGVEIGVTDTGVGMTPADMEKALEPFTQVDSRLSRRYEGVGLGLPLVKSMTEAHGGTFRLESTVGKGTVARIVLPAARVLQNKQKSPPLRATSPCC